MQLNWGDLEICYRTLEDEGLVLIVDNRNAGRRLLIEMPGDESIVVKSITGQNVQSLRLGGISEHDIADDMEWVQAKAKTP